MSEKNETRVLYKALADFTALHRAATRAKKSIQELKDEESALNTGAVTGAAKATKARKTTTKAVKEEEAAVKSETVSILNNTIKKVAATQAAQRLAQATKNVVDSVNRATGAYETNGRHAAKGTGILTKLANTMGRVRTASQSMTTALGRQRTAMGQSDNGANKLYRSFVKLGNWRPRLTPPFIALIPIIGGVVGAINPLVSLLGAAGGAAIGFGNSLSSMAGAALAIPGILGAVAAGISSVVGAFGGIGSAFSAFGAMQKAGAGGGGGGGAAGPSREDRANALADAEDRVARASRNVTKAQTALNKARRQALKDLINLREEVSRNGLDEERAIANLARAREEYANVMAAPGSTNADKLDAAASVAEAMNDLEDVRRENVEQVEELAEAEQKGVEQSDVVLDAQEALTDAYKEQRDALRDLRKEQSGENYANAGGGGGGGVDEYAAALAKLSPSARAFVVGIVAMREEWAAMKKEVQEEFFSKIVDNLGDIQRMIPVIGNLWIKAAGAMGNFFSNGIEMISSPEWIKDFDFIADSNVTIIDNLGASVLSLMDALRNLVVAAMPFTIAITEGWAEGAANMADILQNARDTGSLAKWLEKVQVRLEQWWTIVKNVGATLFNYGSAASGFGDWITQGLVDITEGWKKSSEAAKEEDSPFKQWLEDIKPVLSELKRSIDLFFGWFAEESADPKNLQQIEDILKTINDDLGPAVSKLLDVLTEAEVGPSFVEAITAIVEALTGIMENGGAEAMSSFWDTIVGFFQTLRDILKDPVWGPVLREIGKALGVIAALTFVGKFTGLTNVIGVLAGITGKESAIVNIFKSLAGFKDGKFPGWIGMLKSLVKVAGLAGAIALVFDTIKNGQEAFEGVPEKLENGDYHKGTKNKGEAVQNLNKDINEDGAFVKTVAPITGMASGVVGMFSEDAQTEFDRFLGELGTNVANFVTVDVPRFFIDLGPNIAAAAGDIWTFLTGPDSWLATQWTALNTWFIELPGNVTTWVGDMWLLLTGPDSWLGMQLASLQRWFNRIPENVRIWVGDMWNRLTGPDSWLGKQFPALSRWFHSLPENVRSWVGDMWNRLTGPDGWLNSTWNRIMQWARDLPGAVGRSIGNLFKNVTATVQGFFSASGGSVNPQGSTGSSVKDKNGRKINPGMATGGTVPQYLATGGRAMALQVRDTLANTMRPKGTDTVPTMLTPGEVVIRKGIVDKVGENNLLALNRGVMSYQELLGASMSRASGPEKKKNSGSGAGYFDGGGLVPSLSSSRGASLGSSAAAGAQQAGNTVIDNRTIIENLTVQNPAPEPVSESLPRNLRKVGYLTSARSN